MDSILKDSGLDNLNSLLGCKTQYSQDTCVNLLKQHIHFPNIRKLQYNQNIINKCHTFDPNIMNPLFDKFSDLEKDCSFFFEKKSLDSLEQDTFGQLLFQHELLKHLNEIPYLLLLVSYIKIYFVPIVSVLSPIVMYFIPYILIKYIWGMPISFEMYQSIIGKLWSFDLTTSPQKLLQNAFTIFTIIQSMYQPIQNAFHLYTIDSTIVKLGSSIIDYFNHVEILQKITGFHICKLPSIERNDVRKNFFHILENPNYIKHIFERVSYFEILWRIYEKKYNKIQLYNNSKPYFKADHIFDIHLNEKTRIGSPFCIQTNKNHYLLSGPNGGGKSSFLRGILQTIILSQTFGYSPSINVHMTPFDIIFSGLHIQDTPGNKSLFEKEICFARDVLYNNNPAYKCFVLFDEIFHSTNPPDSIKTSNKFLHKLWSYDHFASIVSTHVFEIIEESPEYIHKICVDSTRENGVLKHTYKVQDGINKESSVEMIWSKEFNAVS